MDYLSYEQGRQQGRNESQNGGDGGGLLLAILAAIILIWACLYPLSTFAAGTAWFLIHSLLEDLGNSQTGFNRVLILYLVPTFFALIVLWIASRLDHRLSLNGVYRAARHGVRLMLVAVVVSLTHLQLQCGISPVDLLTLASSEPSGIIGVCGKAAAVLVMDPVRCWLALAAVLLAHFWLWNWRWWRHGWNGALEGLRLRPRITG